ncbi:hypothetical protein [Rhodococcus qingshengii]|uniref:hypothetical protein n=1 Tax=Rhodococcus qingshengii TaxID=334542 RepID=UPI001E57AA5E|nr:hypothetical protein [Rhodococcus qingshengii]UDF21582.1 hypothetical protein LE551_01480 [Rhodococcus qingshengii]
MREGEQVFLPIGVLRKRVIQRLDVTHEGNSLPVLTSSENGEITIAFIDYLVSKADIPSERACAVRAALRAVVEYNSASGDVNPLKIAQDTLKAAFSDVPDMSKDAQICARLLVSYAELFAENFLLVVVISAEFVSQRVVLKYSLDQPFEVAHPWSSISSLTFSYTPASCWSDTSYHVEIDLPSSLAIVEVAQGPSSSQSAEGAGDEVRKVVEARKGIANSPSLGGSRSHVVLTTQHVVEENAELSVTTVPGPHGIRRFTVWAAAIVLALVLASIPARLCNVVVADAFIIPSSVAPVVLVGPALLLSWIGRSREHDVVSNLLLPLRGVLMACSMVLVLLAVLAAVPVKPWVWHTTWGAIYLLTIVFTVLVVRLYWSYHKAMLKVAGAL